MDELTPEQQDEVDEVTKQLQDEIVLWTQNRMSINKMVPDLNLLASGAEAIREMMVAKGICTAHELNIMQKQCFTRTLKETRETYLANEAKNKIILPGGPRIIQ